MLVRQATESAQRRGRIGWRRAYMRTSGCWRIGLSRSLGAVRLHTQIVVKYLAARTLDMAKLSPTKFESQACCRVYFPPINTIRRISVLLITVCSCVRAPVWIKMCPTFSCFLHTPIGLLWLCLEFFETKRDDTTVVLFPFSVLLQYEERSLTALFLFPKFNWFHTAGECRGSGAYCSQSRTFRCDVSLYWSWRGGAIFGTRSEK